MWFSWNQRLKMSFRNILNRTEFRMEPWGTPVITSVQSLKEPFIELLWFLLHKQSCISLKDILEKPYAFNFVNSKLWSVVSKFGKSQSLLPIFYLLYPNSWPVPANRHFFLNIGNTLAKLRWSEKDSLFNAIICYKCDFFYIDVDTFLKNFRFEYHVFWLLF